MNATHLLVACIDAAYRLKKAMQRIKITELRQHFPAYLKQVKEGEEIQITKRGKVIARIVSEQDESQKAKAFLKSLRGTVYVGDAVSPIEDVEWTGDDDNL